MTAGAASASPADARSHRPRRDVHAVPDVVVPLHEDHIAACQPGANGDGLHRADLADHVVQLQNGLEKRPGVDAHQHDAVTEPLGDANAPAGTDVAQQGPECGQYVNRTLIPLHLG